MLLILFPPVLSLLDDQITPNGSHDLGFGRVEHELLLIFFF
jgi:hypothetical protein